MGVPSTQYNRVISALKNDIKANNGNLTTGIFGTQFFFEILAENGLNDLAYEAMNKRTQPSFGWWIDQGATTTWEQWDGQYSRNHPMFGGSLVWFYRKLAGMNTDPEKPGYKHIIFRPQPVGDLKFAKYFTQTSYGEAGIYWKDENQQFSMQVIVPVGSEATVYIPIRTEKQITESGKLLTASGDVKFIREELNYKVYAIKSGNYQFVSK
jgi:alpha-L-rhamnosidase